eukprot:TRINITY_DN964_c0_g1_i6.p3 TRINITY_DN964_c0_g1~~TRINITY_DN964_c0_g1_i6.p3  ORF type:complete len:252 (+),score=35.78 TRINITY_DN964_c0_g1_i6:117-872(+)
MIRIFQRYFQRLLSRHIQLTKFSSASFSTKGPKKYVDIHEIGLRSYVELSEALWGAYTCKMFGILLKENLNQLTDYQLSFALYRIYDLGVELDEHFYDVIIPIVKEYIKNMDRESNKSLAEIVQYLGWMNVQDDSVWQLIEQKLLGERLHRYLPLQDVVKCAHAMAVAGKGSDNLFQTFEKYIIKHRLWLNEDTTSIAKDAFQIKQLGSPQLFSVLEDPHRDLEQAQRLEDKSGKTTTEGRRLSAEIKNQH